MISFLSTYKKKWWCGSGFGQKKTGSGLCTEFFLILLNEHFSYFQSLLFILVLRDVPLMAQTQNPSIGPDPVTFGPDPRLYGLPTEDVSSQKYDNKKEEFKIIQILEHTFDRIFKNLPSFGVQSTGSNPLPRSLAHLLWHFATNKWAGLHEHPAYKVILTSTGTSV